MGPSYTEKHKRIGNGAKKSSTFCNWGSQNHQQCNSDARSSAVDSITTTQQESKSHHALTHCKPSCCDFTTAISYTEGCSTNNQRTLHQVSTTLLEDTKSPTIFFSISNPSMERITNCCRNCLHLGRTYLLTSGNCQGGSPPYQLF